MKSVVLAISCFLWFIISIKAQELPPIQTFTPQEYGAEDQNWSIAQDDDNFIYIANNKGLLEFNGARWRLHNSPNESILRSVKVINNKIYTGCYMDFGYWERNDAGGLNYFSISEHNNVELKEDEEFWNILEYDHWILFQSLDRIYIYNTLNSSINVIKSDTRITKAYKVKETIYFQKLKEGLYKIQNGEEFLVSKEDELINNILTNIFPYGNGLMFHTKENGFYIFEDNQLQVWKNQLNSILSQNSIYSSIQLKDGSYILGTVSNGIIHLDQEGNVNFTMNQSDGLSNNTVLSIFEDKFGNIWLGLDNGVNVVNLNSQYKVYNDGLGVLGTIYTASIHQNYLYLGTNQGLFCKPLNSKTNFTLIPNTNGQVWNLDVIDNTLFCSHDKGTFLIEKDQSTKIYKDEGTWKVKSIPGNPNLLIQGNYDGLYVLEKTLENTWNLKNKIEGFDISSRYFEFSGTNTLLISHEYKGVYVLNLNDDYTRVTSFVKDSISNGIKSSLIKFENKIYYAFNEGVFVYDKLENKFLRDSILSQVYNKNTYVSGKLIHDEKNRRIWGFSENNITYSEPAKLTSSLKNHTLALPDAVRRTKAGYENILQYKDNQYLLGTTKGYIIIDLDKDFNTEYQLKINDIQNYKLNEPVQFLNVYKDTLLSNKHNNLKFEYSITNFNKFLPTKYSYRLLGFNDEWSNYTRESQALYENLPHGSYTFEVKSKTGDNPTLNTAKFNFSIDKPWYLTTIAIVIYVLMFIIFSVIIHNIYKGYYKKQRSILLDKKERELEFKELENQKQLIQFKNKNLQQDVENKNRELGISTMNLIKKNELLNSIKKEINTANQVGQLKNVIKLINKNLNATDDWKLFEEAFNNADKDFLKEIKGRHSTLTSNDLRLCAYLRLNLSSKEIAPLLNISPRSVEVKRYRLRKKMDLPHEESLTNYILSI